MVFLKNIRKDIENSRRSEIIDFVKIFPDDFFSYSLVYQNYQCFTIKRQHLHR